MGGCKYVPLAAAWITGEKSGHGRGADTLAPKGAAYGVDANKPRFHCFVRRYPQRANAVKTYVNIFDTHAPFQVNDNLGSASGLMELLIQSHTGTIFIPSASSAVWEKERISGIRVKNGAAVPIAWISGKAEKIGITQGRRTG